MLSLPVWSVCLSSQKAFVCLLAKHLLTPHTAMPKSKKSKKSSHRHYESDSSSSSSEASLPEEQLTMDDFYRKSAEYRYWLKHKKRKTFDELSGDDARYYFKKFIKKWNYGDLPTSYYNGSLAPGNMASSSQKERTEYKWGFAQNLTGDDRRRLDAIHAASERAMPQGTTAAPATRRQAPQGPAMIPSSKELGQYSRDLAKKDRREFKRYHKEVMEELVPKETGHAARISKKKGAREQRAARAMSPPVRDSVLMGLDGDAFKTKLARRKEHQERVREKRRTVAEQKVAAHHQKEQDTMAALLAMAKSARSSNALWQPK
eukprot:m.49586 g.49586  ORF g.49586 m.49586 type:complete len:318 (+) comp11105_c0_seq1:29-982(+)